MSVSGIAVRCQCKSGDPCPRDMTAEDLLCDWCRGEPCFSATTGGLKFSHCKFHDLKRTEVLLS